MADRPRSDDERPRSRGGGGFRGRPGGGRPSGGRPGGTRPGGGRPGGGGAVGPRRPFDRPRDDRPRDDRPRDDRSYGDRSYGDRSYGDRSYGDRSYGDRPNGDRGPRGGGSRPAEHRADPRSGQGRRWDRDRDDRDERAGDRGRGFRPGGREGGFGPRDERPREAAYDDRGGERSRERNEGGRRAPGPDRGSDRGYGDRPRRPTFGARPYGDRPQGERPGRPWRRDDAFEDRPYEDRRPRRDEGGGFGFRERNEDAGSGRERGGFGPSRPPQRSGAGRGPWGDRSSPDRARPWERGGRRPDPESDAADASELVEADSELVAGRHPVEEAFAARRPARRLLVVPQRRTALEALVLHATTLRLPVVEVEGGTLTSIAGFDGHQGVALVTEARAWATVDDVLALARQRSEPPFVLVLDSLEDPQNMGTLLRAAEAAGVHGVLFPTRRAAPLTPAAVKASAGAVEHLLLVPADDLPGALADLHSGGLRVVGAEAEAALTHREADLRGPLALVVGSEGRGLGAPIRRRLDLSVRIPMRGRVGSLNAAVAGSILLFEAAGQRDLPAREPRPGDAADAADGNVPPSESAAQAVDEAGVDSEAAASESPFGEATGPAAPAPEQQAEASTPGDEPAGSASVDRAEAPPAGPARASKPRSSARSRAAGAAAAEASPTPDETTDVPTAAESKPPAAPKRARRATTPAAEPAEAAKPTGPTKTTRTRKKATPEPESREVAVDELLPGEPAREGSG